MAKRDNHKAAKALAEWALTGFSYSDLPTVAKDAEVSTRTVERWKDELEKNAELSDNFRTTLRSLVEDNKEQIEALQKTQQQLERNSWVAELDRSLSGAIKEAFERVSKLDQTPEALKAINELIKNLGELGLAKQVIDYELSSNGQQIPHQSASDKAGNYASYN